MSRPDERAKRPLGLVRLSVWMAMALLGLLIWAVELAGVSRDHALFALLVNFLYFTPLCAGLFTWSAVIEAARGRWPGPLAELASLGLGFSVPSVLLLVVLWIGSGNFIPWAGKSLPQGTWLAPGFVFARNLALLILFWALCWLYLGRRKQRRGYGMAGWFMLGYGLVFSLQGFDLAMALNPRWVSSLAGGYFSISGMYTGVLTWTVLAAFHPHRTRERLHDLGKLVVAFALLTTYFFYSQLLIQWYENLPAEASFLVPRMNTAVGFRVSLALIALPYLGPLVLLLPIRAKQSRWYLLAVSLLLLAGMWVERWWVVMPSVQKHPELGWADLGGFLLCLGLLGLGFDAVGRALPVWPGKARGAP